MTQAELGALLMVTQQQVASYEKGEKRIPVSRIPRLAECLSVDMKELVIGQDSASAKRGPAPKIQQQLEQIRLLPKSEQQFVSKLLENVLEKAAVA
jgi:transcriptional regulator with XRE-family HTH domain